jgi:hypothetical protein
MLGWLLGVVGGAAASLLLFMVDDSCPQWEDEGRMAAPHSPYSQVMCAPFTSEPPFVRVVALAGLLTLAVALWKLRHVPQSRPRALGASAALLVAPALLLGLLQVSLPQSCLGGETHSGNCSRDRGSR